MCTVAIDLTDSTDVLDDGTMIVLSGRGNALVHLNRTATFACQSLRDRGGNLADAAQHVASTFNISQARARTDLERLIEVLVQHGLARTLP